MDLRSTLRKAAGLLVELPPEEEEFSSQSPQPRPSGGSSEADKLWAELEAEAKTGKATPATAQGPPRTIEQIVREAPGPNLDQIVIPASAMPVPGEDSAPLDFTTIYASASLPATPFTAEQASDMLAALPQNLPIETKRQMMSVTINSMGKAIGASQETIVADASRKLAALASYSEHLNQLTAEYLQASEAKIAALQAEIEAVRTQMSKAQQRQVLEGGQCAQQSQKMDDLMEFFSLDQGVSKYAAPSGESPAGG